MSKLHLLSALALLAGAAPVGAIEVTVGTNADACDFTSLQAAIDFAPANPAAPRLDILVEGGFEVRDSLRIDRRHVRLERALGRNCSRTNPRPELVVVTGDEPTKPALEITGSNVEILGFLFQDTDVDVNGNGAFVGVDSEVTILDTSFVGNSARNRAPIDLRSGEYNFGDVTATGNESFGANGGAIACRIADDSDVPVLVDFFGDTRLNGNRSAQDGGALAIGRGCEVRVSGTRSTVAQFVGNDAQRDGGAISVEGAGTLPGSLGLVEALVADNRATRNGGAISVGSESAAGRFDADAAISFSTLSGNSAGANGGALALLGSLDVVSLDRVTVTASRLVGNTARLAGGALHARDRNFEVVAGCSSIDPPLPADTYCAELRDNRAGEGGETGTGGAIALVSASGLVDRVALIGNSAGRNAAVIDASTQAHIEVRSSLIASSSTTAPTGAVPLVHLRSAASGTLAFDTFTGNGAGAPFQVDTGSDMLLFGNLSAGNAIALPTSFAGTVRGGCNAFDRIGIPLPDPKLFETARGHFRLASISPLKNGALLCDNLTDPGEPLEDFELPNLDLDGTRRAQAGEQNAFELDIGAFEAVPAGSVSLSADRTIVPAGESVTLTWTSRNVRQCDLSSLDSRKAHAKVLVPPNDSTTVVVTQRVQFALVCESEDGFRVTDGVVVSVAAPTGDPIFRDGFE